MATNNNINIQDLFKSYVGNGKDTAPHDEGQRKFEKKHITVKQELEDPKLGAKNDQFQPDKVKIIDREKTHHGYNVDKDTKVYSEEAEELAEASVDKDGYYVHNDSTSKLSHPADKPFADSKTAIRHAMKQEDVTGRVHTVTHVKGGNINKQWQGGEDYNKSGGYGFHPYDDHKGDKFWHKPANIDEEVELEEKHLTPAEMKKREEIAMAMERSNPGMDKSKKMAIATAQAKKVAEETNITVKKVSAPDAFKKHTAPSVSKPSAPRDPKTGKTLYQKVTGINEEHADSCACSGCMTKKGKRMTKEDVINATVARLLPEDFTPPTIEEKFTRAIDGLSEQMALTLVGLYESLNTDNQEQMVAQMSTKEGMNKLIDFAINNKGE